MIEKYPNCLEYRDDHNSTPFVTACGFGRVQLVEKLINDHNANIDRYSLYVFRFNNTCTEVIISSR